MICNNEETLEALKNARECFWENPSFLPFCEAEPTLKFSKNDIEDASARLERFAPLIMKHFPETVPAKGLIESPIKEISEMKKALGGSGRLLLKMDSHLPIAGSVKARGGIYEVLKHTEELALKAGLLAENSDPADYEKLSEHRDFYGQYKMQVGSTGNLGMSIGIMSAAIGYNAIVHMSADAKEWKKKLLRSKGVTVVEYADDYSRAVAEGRKLSDADPMSYFVDDESSSALFLGYAVAGKRLKKQLDDKNITVNKAHPLCVYVPCGVGGAPGGICFGLKECFGDDVKVFFEEPVQCPSMLAALASGKGAEVSVHDFGLTGKTDADGLACARASALVSAQMKHLVSGEATVCDEKLYKFMQLLHKTEGVVIEPSSCAAFAGYCAILENYGADNTAVSDATHVIWATGGSLMPPEIVNEYLCK